MLKLVARSWGLAAHFSSITRYRFASRGYEPCSRRWSRILERLGAYRHNSSAGETMRLAFPEWLDAAGIWKFIAGRQTDEGSGDIYCRLAE